MRGKGALLVGICTLLFAFGASGQKKETSTRGQEKWRVGEPVVYENLSIFPLLARGSADTSGFVTLDEGLTSGEVVVTETGGDMLRRTRGGDPSAGIQAQVQGALVNQLVLINRSKKPLLLLAGEVVSGGKQDRIIGKDRIVLPGAEPLPLDVFCVEHGRWTTVSSQFKAANMMAAEYEWGAVPKSLHEIEQRALAGKLAAGKLKLKGRAVYYLCPIEIVVGVEKTIRRLYKNEGTKRWLFKNDSPTRDWVGLKEAVARRRSKPGDVAGWLELDNHFMFFTNRRMFEGTAKLFGIPAASARGGRTGS
jgi:hypothetical protein